MTDIRHKKDLPFSVPDVPGGYEIDPNRKWLRYQLSWEDMDVDGNDVMRPSFWAWGSDPDGEPEIVIEEMPDETYRVGEPDYSSCGCGEEDGIANKKVHPTLDAAVADLTDRTRYLFRLDYPDQSRDAYWVLHKWLDKAGAAALVEHLLDIGYGAVSDGSGRDSEHRVVYEYHPPMSGQDYVALLGREHRFYPRIQKVDSPHHVGAFFELVDDRVRVSELSDDAMAWFDNRR